jgi:hypothetical protein
MGQFLVFPIPAVTVNFQNPSFIPAYPMTLFKTKHTLMKFTHENRPERDPQQMAQNVYSIPCECGRSYIGETGGPLAVRLSENRHNVKEGLLDKPKLAQLAY